MSPTDLAEIGSLPGFILVLKKEKQQFGESIEKVFSCAKLHTDLG